MTLTVPDVRFDEDGLVPVILQDAVTGEILTLAYANAEALAKTAETGETWLYSRSRRALWHKGETSGHVQRVESWHADCDQDALVFRVHPTGPACHRGTRSCFDGAAPPLLALEDRLADRKANAPSDSWTAKLLADPNLRHKKLGEEAVELALACATKDEAAVVSEAADLVYHVAVAALGRDVPLRDVVEELARRLR